MLGDNLRNLEYEKGSRHYEDELNPYAELEDLDEELLNAYKKRIGAEGISNHQVLSARGYPPREMAWNNLQMQQVLLFAEENILEIQYELPGCVYPH